MDQVSTIRPITSGATQAPEPAWVDLASYAVPETANPHFVANGVCVLLDDSQVDLCGPDRAWYYRRAELVTAPAGAEHVARFGASFDPNFQRLEVHTIAVIRGGSRIEHADTGFFEVLRREQNLERLIFDGRLTVHLTIPDVRPGDVVETSYTIYGQRKSLGGRHGAWIPLEWSVGICDVRLRLRTPSSRVVDVYGINGAPEATITEEGGVVDKRWRTWERPGIRFEHLTPPWITENAALQFSEWRNWGEVVATFAPLYEEPGDLPPELESEIARIAAAEPTPAGRAAAALRFTQADVRYLAISIGEGGHTPRALGEICATRYGDCKDKAKLFVAMAQRLGLDACPALVNTASGHAMERWLPSGTVFDHCIVRLLVDGKVYWIDGTRSVQTSPLETISQCHFGFALPLRPNQNALERMPDPTSIHSTQCTERVVLGPGPDVPVRYEWRITSRRGRAEGVREQFARQGEVGLFKIYADDIKRSFPAANPVEQKILEDNSERNELTVLEAYDISQAWTYGEASTCRFATLDLVMKQCFAPLDPGPRKHPVYLGQVGQVTRRVEVESARELPPGGWNREIICSAVSYKSELKMKSKKRFIMEQRLDIRALTLPADEAEKYRAIVADLDRSDLVITETVNSKGKFVKSGGGGDGGVARVLFFLFWAGLAVAWFLLRYGPQAPG